MTRVSVNQGRPPFLWERSTPVIVGCWFASRTRKNKSDLRHQLVYALGLETQAVNKTARETGHFVQTAIM